MAATYILISSQILASSVSSVTFSLIPQTYTDLKLVFSARNSATTGNFSIAYSGATSAYSGTYLQVSSGTVSSSDYASGLFSYYLGNGVSSYGFTSSTFGSAEVYIPSYTSTTSKQVQVNSVAESNTASISGTTMYFAGALWGTTSPVTSITVYGGGGGSSNLLQYSSFYLYGIKNS
jgi:hypothetical protein